MEIKAGFAFHRLSLQEKASAIRNALPSKKRGCHGLCRPEAHWLPSAFRGNCVDVLLQFQCIHSGLAQRHLLLVVPDDSARLAFHSPAQTRLTSIFLAAHTLDCLVEALNPKSNSGYESVKGNIFSGPLQIKICTRTRVLPLMHSFERERLPDTSH